MAASASGPAADELEDAAAPGSEARTTSAAAVQAAPVCPPRASLMLFLQAGWPVSVSTGPAYLGVWLRGPRGARAQGRRLKARARGRATSGTPLRRRYLPRRPRPAQAPLPRSPQAAVAPRPPAVSRFAARAPGPPRAPAPAKAPAFPPRAGPRSR